jgi:phosphate transport system substrate-binding protein
LCGKYLARLSGALLLVGAIAGSTAVAASAAAPKQTLNGAGSTLVAPLEGEWGQIYEGAHSNVTVNYNADGSAAGEAAVAAGLVDFGASDAPLSAYAGSCGNCVQIPWALSATGVGFHVNNLNRLHLTSKVISEIYLGQITNWDNSQIKALNKGESLPNLKITPFFRTDGSGDTYAFTLFESRTNSTWAHRIGDGTSVHWVTGEGAKGNSGMVEALQATNGGIAYVAVSYLALDWPFAAAVQNAAGNFIAPNLLNIADAASSVKTVPSNNQVTIVAPPARYRNAYPISTFTYAMVQRSAKQAALLKSFIGYAIGNGQALGDRLDFVPIPSVVKRADASTLNAIH